MGQVEKAFKQQAEVRQLKELYAMDSEAAAPMTAPGRDEYEALAEQLYLASVHCSTGKAIVRKMAQFLRRSGIQPGAILSNPEAYHAYRAGAGDIPAEVMREGLPASIVPSLAGAEHAAPLTKSLTQEFSAAPDERIRDRNSGSSPEFLQGKTLMPATSSAVAPHVCDDNDCPTCADARFRNVGAAPTPEKCLCIEFAVHRDCPVHGWEFEERKANLADALAKNPLQPTPEKCHDACPQCGSDDRRVFQWGCAADDRHPWHDAASPTLKQEINELRELVTPAMKGRIDDYVGGAASPSELERAEESNCDKLRRERETKRHWQERAEKAESDLKRFTALEAHLPPGFAIGDDATADLAIELAEAESSLAALQREVARLRKLHGDFRFVIAEIVYGKGWGGGKCHQEIEERAKEIARLAELQLKMPPSDAKTEQIIQAAHAKATKGKDGSWSIPNSEFIDLLTLVDELAALRAESAREEKL